MQQVNAPDSSQTDVRLEIYAFTGPAGSGKDYLAQQLNRWLPPARSATVAFADHLKVEASVRPLGGEKLDLAKAFGAKDAATRALLQREGTELGRGTLGPGIWVEFWRAWVAVHRSRGATRFFVPDVRFANEVAALRAFARDEGARLQFFRVVAPERAAARAAAEGRGEGPVHISERPLDLDPWDPEVEGPPITLRNDFGDDDWKAELIRFSTAVAVATYGEIMAALGDSRERG